MKRSRETPDIPAGSGIYTVTDAARLLEINPARLRRWVRGYTYSLDRDRTGEQPPVVETDLPPIDHSHALSFLELMELRVIRRLLEYPEISLQKVRKAGNVASTEFGTRHPFASRRIFTDGKAIFAALRAGHDVTVEALVELGKDRSSQLIASDVVRPFLEEIEYDEHTSLARRWWPLGRDVPIVLDPHVAFGAPTVENTRIRTSMLSGLAHFEAQASLAEAYGVSEGDVAAAVHFEARLAAA